MSAEAGWKPLQRPARRRLGTSAFSRLALSHVLGVGGDTLVTMALAGSLFFSISPDGARGRVALYLLLTMAPFAVVAPLIGPALDRSRGGRRATIVFGAAARSLVCLSMAEHLQGLWLFPEAFVVLVLSKAHLVSKSALVPTTVTHDGELVEANSRLAVLAVAAGFVAAAPGAVVLKLGFLGAPWVMRLAAVAFALCALAGLRIARPEARSVPRGVEARAEAELHGASIRLSVTGMAVLRLVVGFLTFLIAFEFRRTGAPTWWYGLAVGASLVGSFVGAVVAPPLRRMVTEERILLGSLLLVGLVGFVAARNGGRPAVAVLALAVGVAASAGKQAFDSIVQRDAPDAVRGRTFARFETRFQVVWVVGAFLPVVVAIPLTTGMDLIAVAGTAAFVSYVGGLVATRRHPGLSIPELGRPGP